MPPARAPRSQPAGRQAAAAAGAAAPAVRPGGPGGREGTEGQRPSGSPGPALRQPGRGLRPEPALPGFAAAAGAVLNLLQHLVPSLINELTKIFGMYSFYICMRIRIISSFTMYLLICLCVNNI